MSTRVWIELQFNLVEAKPQGYSSENLYIAGSYAYGRWGTIYDPTETSVPYYPGWANDPNNGYDYFEVSVVAVHLSQKDTSERAPGFGQYNWEPARYVSTYVDDVNAIPIDLIQRSTADIVAEQLNTTFNNLISAFATYRGYDVVSNAMSAYELHGSLQSGVTSLMDVVDRGIKGEISPEQMAVMGPAVVQNMILSMAQTQGVPPIVLDAVRNTSYIITRDAPSPESLVQATTSTNVHGKNPNDAVFLEQGANDFIIGGIGNNVIYGDVGDDILVGNKGRDTITGGYGSDYIYGGEGDDNLILKISETAYLEFDFFDGGSGANDRLSVTNTWFSGFVIDVTKGEIKYDVHTLAKFKNIEVFSNFANDVTIVGSQKADTIYVSGKNNLVTSGDGNDALYGGAYADQLLAGNGNDRVLGGAGNDFLFGMDGNDRLIGGLGADILEGGAGSDTASYESAATGVTVNLTKSALNTGDAKGDKYVSIESLIGSNYADKLYGNGLGNTFYGGDDADTLFGYAGNDKLFGGNGNDMLVGGADADAMAGGGGTDRALYLEATAGVTVSLLAPSLNTGEAKGDTFSSVENLTGSNFNDSLFGNATANAIGGGAGNDLIKGYAGLDILTGGTGNDAFVFDTKLNAVTNVDTITDYNVAADTIRLENAIYTTLTATGVLSAAAFIINASGVAADSSDRIIYETDTGKLFYDRDGSGSAFAGIQFAKLAPGLAITNADFFII